jgi:hypothetical protein
LLFEDAAGNPTAAHASGLAGYLGQQRGLVLVFLNGCCTEPQVRRLRDAGVKAVVATTWAIEDTVAAEFAKTFYAELTARSLRDAFDTAVHAVQLRWGDDPRAVIRDVATPDEHDTPRWPWIIDCDPEYEAWTPGSETAEQPGRGWRGRLLFATAAMAMLATMSLAFSAEARRTTCRAPGLRSLCAAVGIGDVPTPAEQALWDEALAQRSGSGLRRYLHDYPSGVHAVEATSRLLACQHERVETLGPERDVRFVLAVSPIPTRPLLTLDDAQRDAVTRGNRDAATDCEPQRRNARLLSAVAEPHEWNCPPQDHGFACGFDGEIVCRVRDLIESDDEHCHDKAK